MTCPHCHIEFHAHWQPVQSVGVPNGINQYDNNWQFSVTVCPACKLPTWIVKVSGSATGTTETFSIWPIGATRPLSPEVPEPFRSEFLEACAVLDRSEKASAALSRRCLQMMLVEQGQAKKKDLFDQIEEIIPSLPASIADSLHAVRNIGNFAAHPMKSKATGEIVDVEAGEAEWNLDTLEELFDFYFVRPAAHEKRKQALNAKLTEIGKPTI